MQTKYVKLINMSGGKCSMVNKLLGFYWMMSNSLTETSKAWCDYVFPENNL